MAGLSPLLDTERINEANREASRLAFSDCTDAERTRMQTEHERQTQRGRVALAEWQERSAPRLVKALKSPTRPEALKFVNDWAAANPGLKPLGAVFDPVNRKVNNQRAGVFAVVESREWAGEYRIRTENQMGYQQPPEPQTGTRWTQVLSERGAKKIAESCYYVATKRGGYTTFLTLTLTPEARERLQRFYVEPAGEADGAGFCIQYPAPLAATEQRGHLGGYIEQTIPDDPKEYAPDWESQDAENLFSGPYIAIDSDSGRPFNPVTSGYEWSLQREASRFFDGLQRMYKRGWQYQDNKGRTVRVPGSRALYCVEGPDQDGRTGAEFTRLSWWREPLDYLWVAEAPDQIDEETGEVTGTNPHLHILMRWRVPYRHFAAWAERIENLWGQGWAHLEKIEQPERAGAYVAKAAGYLCKGQGKDPKKDQGQIRGNRYGIATRARAPGWIEQERYQAGVMGWLLAEAHERWNEKHGEKIERRDRLKYQLAAANDSKHRQKIGRILEQTRQEIEPLPRCSKYQAILKSRDQLERFMKWARRQGFEEQGGTGQWLNQWRANQWHRRNGKRLRADPQEVTDWLSMADAGAVALNESDLDDWGLYADMGVVHMPGLSAAGV